MLDGSMLTLIRYHRLKTDYYTNVQYCCSVLNFVADRMYLSCSFRSSFHHILHLALHNLLWFILKIWAFLKAVPVHKISVCLQLTPTLHGP